MDKKVIVILYEFFYPGYKAGGPIQSLVNMVQLLEPYFVCKVITTAYDLNTPTMYTSMQPDSWNTVQLPATGSLPIDIWYDSEQKPSLRKLHRAIVSSEADVLFINGFYTHHFLFPLILRKLNLVNIDCMVVSPRGMLQKGALAIKPIQKKIYLSVLRIFGLCKKVVFHATTEDEATDIRHVFGKGAMTIVAGNVPKLPWSSISTVKKVPGVLNLVYLSIITPKKNLLLLLKELKGCKGSVNLYIYGPVKEDWYWKKCMEEMQVMPPNVLFEYMGHIPAHEVQDTLSKYDAMILLTEGENFGHALYESLSVGTPIITSLYTPWTRLTEQSAGWNVEIGQEKNHTFRQLIDHLVLKENIEWLQWREGALKMASGYYYGQSFKNEYMELFDGKSHS